MTLYARCVCMKTVYQLKEKNLVLKRKLKYNKKTKYEIYYHHKLFRLIFYNKKNSINRFI